MQNDYLHIYDPLKIRHNDLQMCDSPGVSVDKSFPPPPLRFFLKEGVVGCTPIFGHARDVPLVLCHDDDCSSPGRHAAIWGPG